MALPVALTRLAREGVRPTYVLTDVGPDDLLALERLLPHLSNLKGIVVSGGRNVETKCRYLRKYLVGLGHVPVVYQGLYSLTTTAYPPEEEELCLEEFPSWEQIQLSARSWLIVFNTLRELTVWYRLQPTKFKQMSLSICSSFDSRYHLKKHFIMQYELEELVDSFGSVLLYQSLSATGRPGEATGLVGFLLLTVTQTEDMIIRGALLLKPFSSERFFVLVEPSPKSKVEVVSNTSDAGRDKLYELIN